MNKAAVLILLAFTLALTASPRSRAASRDQTQPEASARPRLSTTRTPQAQSQRPPTRATSPHPGTSRPVFDWSKYKDATEVPHPFAKKGLTHITKERAYIYRVDESEQKRAAAVRFGIFDPVNLENPDQAGLPGATFEENYDQTDNPAILVDYEWQLWKSPIGKWGAKAGSGVYVAQGHGHFVSEVNQGLTPMELFTFVLIPINVGAVYRLQIWDKQLFVPYAEGGLTAFGFGEFRDDDKPPKWGGSPAGYYAGGLALNLSYFDYLSRVQLDREYGINAVYLTVEYRGIVSFSQNYDFSSDLFNAGFLMEY
ncbi:MAG: hypothetical protein AB7G93_04115 [Bdellovibrionales bacterium]